MARENLWLTARTGLQAGHGVGSVGVMAAQGLTGSTTVGQVGLAIMTGATVSASATGVGLIVAGGLLTVGSAGLAVRSAYKTNKHVDNLKKISNHPDLEPFCVCESLREGASNPGLDKMRHDQIAGPVLQYIIQKKRTKLHRKVGNATVVYSPIELGRSVGKGLYKRARGTRSVHRTQHAEALADHFLTYNCGLAQAIVAELRSSVSAMFDMRGWQHQDVVNRLMDKIAST